MRNWLSKWANVLFTIWVGLTILILLNNFFFGINEYISHPQHGHFDDFDEVSSIIKSNHKEFFYKAYFFLDAVWALLLLIVIGNLVGRRGEEKIFKSFGKEYFLITIYIPFAIVGYIADIFEGIKYLNYDSWGLANAVGIKIVCYTICMAVLAYWTLKKYVIPNVRAIIRFFLTSALSLLFIGVVYGLVTLMPQGGTLVVELFYDPGNIILFFLLLMFLSIIISHFPVYVDIWRYGRDDKIALDMAKKGVRLFGFGIIYYFPLGEPFDRDKAHVHNQVKKLRRSLGILLYAAVFNIFIGIGARFFESDISAIGLSTLVMVITLLVYNHYGKRYNSWKKNLSDPNVSSDIKKNTVAAITKYVGFFPNYFLICSALVVLTAVLAYFYQWHRITLLLFLVSLGLQTFLYVYFKICRSYFKYVFYTDNLYTKKKVMFDDEILDLFKEHGKKFDRSKRFFEKWVAWLSDNVSYLKLMRGAGIISLLLLIAANFYFEVSGMLNPLNIILLYIIVFYSLIIIPFKHILFYHRCKTDRKYRDQFRYGFPIAIILLLVVLSSLASKPSDLHQLRIVKQTAPTIKYTDFLDVFTQSSMGKKENYFFIGSYGGGLKANLWNLLLLNELESRSNREFLGRTVAMSGVSGGAVGIGNYTSLLIEQDDSLEIANRIEQIGRSNVLSNELTYLIGRDLIREFSPFLKHQGKDRSFKSMQHHAKLTGMGNNYNEKSYPDYWREILKKRDGRFPALIMNTTSVGGKQGVASTVEFPENTFPGADLITVFSCDRQNNLPGCVLDSTLTFFGAVSTTNRFPFFSPTAKIKNKGSYLDGGYFENSGMLSVVEVYDAVAGDPTKKYYEGINPVFVNIINSENFYIANKLAEWKFDRVKIADAGEIGAIIGTVASIDKLPRYVSEKMEARNFAVEPIMMPHKITYAKVKAVLNSEVDNPIRLMDSIKIHNQIIDSVLIDYGTYKYDNWGVVQPPLARLLSLPAVKYQQAMVNGHPSVRNAINRILYYLQSTTEVTKQDKDSLQRRQVSQNGGRILYEKKKLEIQPDTLNLEQKLKQK